MLKLRLFLFVTMNRSLQSTAHGCRDGNALGETVPWLGAPAEHDRSCFILLGHLREGAVISCLVPAGRAIVMHVPCVRTLPACSGILPGT